MKNTCVRWALIRWIAVASERRRGAADIVRDWNVRSDVIAAERKLASPVLARNVTLMHVAIFEALNAIDRRYQPYRLNLVADRNTSREAAAAAAGHAMLRGAVSRPEGRAG